MHDSRPNQGNLLRFLALCGIAAPIIFAILVTVGGFIYEGYSHATQAVSELGGVEAQSPIIQNTNFLVIGVLFIAFAFGLHRGVGGGRGVDAWPGTGRRIQRLIRIGERFLALRSGL